MRSNHSSSRQTRSPCRLDGIVPLASSERPPVRILQPTREDFAPTVQSGETNPRQRQGPPLSQQAFHSTPCNYQHPIIISINHSPCPLTKNLSKSKRAFQARNQHPFSSCCVVFLHFSNGIPGLKDRLGTDWLTICLRVSSSTKPAFIEMQRSTKAPRLIPQPNGDKCKFFTEIWISVKRSSLGWHGSHRGPLPTHPPR